MNTRKPQMTLAQRQVAQSWADNRRAWFKANPTRQFQSVPLSQEELEALGPSGYIVGAFDWPPFTPGSVVAKPLLGPQVAIARRSGTDFVVLLIPAAPSRFDPPEGSEEKFLAGFWMTAQFAAARGLSSREMLEGIPEVASSRLPSLH